MDRNYTMQIVIIIVDTSLSVRRAWIEIVYPGTWSGSILVALRKESVDRNQNCCPYLSSLTVALRKESVDRNLYYGDDLTFADGRSP